MWQIEPTKPFVLILSPFTHFAVTMAQELVFPRIQVNLFSFFLLQSAVNEVRKVPESPVGTGMTHLMWIGTKCSCQAEALTLATSKADEFHLPMSRQVPSKRRKPPCQGWPSKNFPAVLSPKICLGAIFQEHFRWGNLIISHPLQVCVSQRPGMAITCFEHCKSGRAMWYQSIHQIWPCSSNHFITSCSYNGQV